MWAVANVNEFNLHLYRGGFLLVDVAACLTIAAAVHPGSPFGPRLLGCAPLRWVGVRSYGIYLWHWPIYMLTRPHLDIALAGVPLLALRVGLTVAAADLSYRYIEQPVRARALRPRPEYVERRFPSFASVALMLSGLLIAGVLALPTHTTTAPLTVASPGPAITPRPSAVTVQPTVPTTVRRVFFTPRTTLTSLAPPPPTVPTTLGPPPRVTAVGDSVMLDASAALIQKVSGIWIDASIGRLFPSGLADLTALQGAGRLGPEVVVHLGTNGILTSGQFDQLLKLLQGEHRVVVVNVSVPRPWEGPVNDVLAAGVTRWPNAVLADWHAVATAHPQIFWSDGVHLRPEGAQLYATLIAGAL
jgi:hypothetical protein